MCNSITRLLIENENRPEIQEQIRAAAIQGAKDSGYNLILGYDNVPKSGNAMTYKEWEFAISFAIGRIEDTVNLD